MSDWVGLTFAVHSWEEVDEHGTRWFCSQEVFRDPRWPIGPVQRSRVSRMRAESYVLAERAKELHDLYKDKS